MTSDTSYKTKKCPLCGANIEITEFEDGSVLTRQDCMCDLSEQIEKNSVNPENLGNYHKSDLVKSSQLGFEVPEK